MNGVRHNNSVPVQGCAPKCDLAGCHRPSLSRTRNGLCSTHARQRGRGAEPRLTKSPRTRGARSARDELGRKECPDCHTWKNEEMFYRNRCNSDGLSHSCTTCHRQYKRNKLYGPKWQGLIERQSGLCAICNGDLGGGYAVDHDHRCCPGRTSCGSCVRGALCRSCNLALGGFSESVEILTAAIDYLQASQVDA